MSLDSLAMSLTVVWAATGCSSATPAASTRVVIDVDAPTALADHAVHMKITDLEPHDRVVVDSSATAHDGKVWRADATFTADKRGIVDLTTARPQSGSYDKADGMGLFWSMRPPSGNPNQASFFPLYPELAPSYKCRISVAAHGRPLASRTLTCEWQAPGVRSRALSLAHDKVAGEAALTLAASPAPRDTPRAHQSAAIATPPLRPTDHQRES